jgi:hypothetical protein
MTSKPFRWAFPLQLMAGACLLSTVILSPIPAGAETSKSSRTTFSYSCCTAYQVNTVYHPGGALKLQWIPKRDASNNYTATTITLSASISGPFRSVTSLKTDFSRSHPKLGVVNSKALTIRLSNRESAHPVSLIHIPANASKGFYELTTSIKDGPVTSGGGSVIRISP